MHEQLSRLLAGELDPAAEAALLLRIAADPELAEAWAAMCALPERLAELPLDAPPPGLMNRLYAMTEAWDPEAEPTGERVFDAAELDAAPFAPDPREDTIDRAPTSAERPRRMAAPARVEVSRPSPRPARPVWAWAAGALAVGALALTALFLSELAVPPDLTLPPEGESLVQGDVNVRAGDLRVRVDGRARIRVTPEGAVPADASLVVVGERPAERPRDRSAAPALPAPTPGRHAVGGDTPAVRAATDAGASFTGTLSSAGVERRSLVTVSVERGTAVIETGERPIRVDAGQTRAVATTAVTPVPSPRGLPTAPSSPIPEDPTAVPEVNPDRARAEGPLLAEGTEDESHLAVVELEGELGRLPPEEDWAADVARAVLADLDRADVRLAELDCTADPCLAVYVGGDGADWGALTADLRGRLPDDVEVWSSHRSFLADDAALTVTVYALSAWPDLPAELPARARAAADRVEDGARR